MSDRIYGLIYGQFIGDALGTRYEFKSSSSATTKIQKDLHDDFLPIKGGGPFHVLPGQTTDDTELAMALCHSLLDTGKYDREDIARRYIKWYKSDPFDVGTTTSRAFSKAKDYSSMVQNSSKSNEHSLSNGCLMRISPLAVYGLTVSDSDLIRCARENCCMTNPNELTQDAVSVYCVALKACLQGQDRKTIFDRAYQTSQNETIRSILRDALKRPSPTLLPSGDTIRADGSNMGYCGIALQNTFYELMNGKSFYDSIVNIVKRGGDTDTNGCIAGALLGAFYGVHNIPKQWAHAIKMENPRSKSYPEIDQLNLDVYIRDLISVMHLE